MKRTIIKLSVFVSITMCICFCNLPFSTYSFANVIDRASIENVSIPKDGKYFNTGEVFSFSFDLQNATEEPTYIALTGPSRMMNGGTIQSGYGGIEYKYDPDKGELCWSGLSDCFDTDSVSLTKQGNTYTISTTVKDGETCAWELQYIEVTVSDVTCNYYFPPYPQYYFDDDCANGNHSYYSDSEKTVDKEPTCAEYGSKSIKCIICGSIVEKTIEEIPPTDNHQYGSLINLIPPTCTESGIQAHYDCVICKAVFDTKKNKTTNEQLIIPAKGHSYGEWTTTKKPTCTEKGSKEKICTECGDKVSEEIAAMGHTWKSSYTVDKKATYAAKGSKSIHCSVCNAIKEGSSVSIPKLTVKATTLSSVIAAKKAFTVKWKKGSKINGYQIQYALNSKFTKGAKKVTITKSGTVSKKITKLKAKKKYYVRVRTYKKVSGKTYYSKWSKYKYVTTK